MMNHKTEIPNSLQKLTSKLLAILNDLNKPAEERLFFNHSSEFIPVLKELFDAVLSFCRRSGSTSDNLLENAREAYRSLFENLTVPDTLEVHKFLESTHHLISQGLPKAGNEMIPKITARIEAQVKHLNIDKKCAEDISETVTKTVQEVIESYQYSLEFIPYDKLFAGVKGSKEEDLDLSKEYPKVNQTLENFLRNDNGIKNLELIPLQILLEQNSSAYSEEKLIDYWKKIVTSYQHLDGNNQASLLAFLNAIYTFHYKLRELFLPLLSQITHEDLSNIYFCFKQMINAGDVPKIESQLSESNYSNLREMFLNVGLLNHENKDTKQVHNVLQDASEELLKSSGYADEAQELKSSEVAKNINVDVIANMFTGIDRFVKMMFVISPEQYNAFFAMDSNQDFSLLKNAIAQNANARNNLVEAMPAIRADVLANQVFKQQRDENRHFANPRINPTDVHLKNREKQAAFKYKVILNKYTITEQETQLLSKATGISVQKLVFKPTSSHSDNVMSYREFITKIDLEISRRNQKNKKFYRKGIFSLFKLRTNHLEAAKSYVVHHYNKTLATKKPELRLKNSVHRNSSESANIKEFNNLLKNLSNIFTSNRDLKKLNVAWYQKKTHTDNMKKEAILLEGKTKQAKAIRNKATYDELARSKILFEPFAFEESGARFNEGNSPSGDTKFLYTSLDSLTKAITLIEKIHTEVKTRFKELTKSESPITNHSSLEMQKLKNMPPKERLKELLTRMHALESSNFSTTTDPEQLQNLINESSLLYISTKELIDLFDMMVKTLPSNELAQVKRMEIFDLHTELTKACKLNENFNPQSSTALPELSQLLHRVKEMKRKMVYAADNFLSALKLEIKAQETVLKILQNNLAAANRLTDVNNTPSLIQYLKNEKMTLEQQMIMKFLKTSDLHNQSHIQLGNSEMLEIINGLDAAIKGLERGDDIATVMRQIIAKIGTLNQELIRKTGVTGKLLESAKETLDGVRYLADHTTAAVYRP